MPHKQILAHGRHVRSAAGLPEWLTHFIPAYKATRIIIENLLESLPQMLLQAYILVAIVHRIHAGTGNEADRAIYDDARVLPQETANDRYSRCNATAHSEGSTQ